MSKANPLGIGLKGGVTISGNKHTNVVIFPKAVDYYQFQLTRLLENERYAEAKGLLEFLLQCDSGDPRTDKEWEALHDWLATSFISPDGSRIDSEEAEGELTESDLAREAVWEKQRKDEHYTDKILQALIHADSMEKKLIALEQIIHMEHPVINDTLLQYLRSNGMHPLLQFRILQVLKLRGIAGPVTVPRNGAALQVNIEETPLGPDQFPSALGEVIEQVRQISEIHHPAAVFFAEQTWQEFIAFIYGTPTYEMLIEQGGTHRSVWASALYYVVASTMLGGESESTAKSLYGVDADQDFQWEQAVRQINSFIESASQP